MACTFWHDSRKVISYRLKNTLCIPRQQRHRLIEGSERRTAKDGHSEWHRRAAGVRATQGSFAAAGSGEAARAGEAAEPSRLRAHELLLLVDRLGLGVRLRAPDLFRRPHRGVARRQASLRSFAGMGRRIVRRGDAGRDFSNKLPAQRGGLLQCDPGPRPGGIHHV